jgi:hypothetical protein
MTDDDEAARKDRLAQAQKLIDLFASANGRPPRSPEEVKKWIDTPDGKAALADHQMPDGKIIPSRERFTPRRNGTVTTRGVRGERPPARSCRNISWQQGQGAQRSRVEGLSVAPRIGSHSPGHLLLSDCDVLVNETGAGLPTRGQAAHQSAERSPAFQRMLFNAKRRASSSLST